MFIKLIEKIVRALSYPLSLFFKRIFGFFILFCIGFVIYSFMGGSGDDASHNTPAKKPRANKNAPVPPPIDPVKKVESGNSAFSEDLLLHMNKEEITYYSRVLYWVMDYKPDGETHEWQFQNIHGSITPVSRFTNGFGEDCRNFHEVLKVHTIQQDIRGVACQKPGEASGWCKLRPNSTPACALGKNGGSAQWWMAVRRTLGL